MAWFKNAHKAFSFTMVFTALMASATASISFATIVQRTAIECERNSDCLRGLVCGGTGRCIAECVEDVDCPAQGLAHACLNTLSASFSPGGDRAVAPALGGGANAYQCVHRGELPPVTGPLPKIHPEISNHDLTGEDFWSFANITGDAQACARECMKQIENCRAWVMYKPTIQGTFARCWLKKSAGDLQENGDAIAGFVR